MKNSVSNPIAERVRYYRNLVRLPQTFVGEKILGLDRTTYTRMESGHILFSTDNLTTLANLYRVNMEDFFAPLQTEPEQLKVLKNVGQFRIKDRLRLQDEEGLGAVGQAVKDLVLWANDPSNAKELEHRQKKASETADQFDRIIDAVQYSQKVSKNYVIGYSLDIYKLIMEEFGIWISWNSLGALSGIYLEKGTEIAPKIKLPLPLIGINASHPSDRQRFSAAHELGHHLFGKNEKVGSPTKTSKDPEEKEADQFAADLLMDNETVKKLFATLTSSIDGGEELAIVVLLTANYLQVSYAAILHKLFSLGVIPFEKQEQLQKTKVQDLQKRLWKIKQIQNFEDVLIGQCEHKLKGTHLYEVDKFGGPKAPGNLRFLQDYCYVDYLKTCKTKTPMDSKEIFQRVASYIFRKYPRYTTA